MFFIIHSLLKHKKNETINHPPLEGDRGGGHFN
jgi:hypothetical protein